MYTLWKKKEGFGGEPIMRPICLQCSTQPLLLQGCDNDNRWYCPECDYEWYKEERLPDATGTKPPEPKWFEWKGSVASSIPEKGDKFKPREDDTIKGIETICPQCGYKLLHQFKTGVIVKREDLQMLIEWAGFKVDADDIDWVEFKRIKEEYNID